ncbi:two-component response regulator ARR14-like [Solanum dulcamara]|uniref:two-component response regulator ARR14-like n=1 Tax=Solanum dulcamara TaxID=45834 RepID=UPI0024859253|nr:two-component response regulator ARR14-like [Solanum dulcamara]
MDLDIFMNREKTDNDDIPSAYVGLRILLIDHDTTSLSNIAIILEEHSYKVTAIAQAILALSILIEHIDEFDLIMVDFNIPQMDCLDFIKSIQLIEDKPIILMSPEVTNEMVDVARAEGACFVFKKSAISSMKLKNVWQHVYLHNKNSNRKSQLNWANQVDVMDNTSRAKKSQDKGKGIAICSETYQDQAVGSLIETNEVEKSKRMRSTNEETQINSGSSEKQDDYSLLSKTRTERPQKKRQRMQWTPDLDKKLDEVVRELGEKAPPRHILEKMCVPDLTKEQLTYRLKKYRSQKQQAPNVQAPNVQPTTSMNFNEERHSNVLAPNDISTNFNELFQGACIPQPSEVPLPSSNDYSLNGWNDLDELLELDNFNAEIMQENQSDRSYNWIDHVLVCGNSTQDNVSTSKIQNP